MKTIVTFIFIMTLVSCSQGSTWIPIAKTQDTVQSADSELTSEESIVVSEPISVGGAFLVCAADEQIVMAEASAGFGCRLESVNGEKFTDMPIEVTDLSVSDGIDYIGGIQIAEVDSFWHWYVPLDYNKMDLYQVLYQGGIRMIMQNTTNVLLSHPMQNQTLDMQMESPYQDRHIIFVTGQGFKPGGSIDDEEPGFSSIAEADLICNDRASRALIPGVFKAILSDSTETANERITIIKPIFTKEGSLVASVSQFWSNTHQGSISSDLLRNDGEEGESFQVWTGTDSKGKNKGSEQCGDWSSSDEGLKGNFGDSSNLKTWVDEPGSTSCDQRLSLYCISQ